MGILSVAGKEAATVDRDRRGHDDEDRDEARERRMLRAIYRRIGVAERRIIQEMEAFVSEVSDQIQAAADATGQAATDAANRVIAAFNDQNSVLAETQQELADAKDQITALQAEIDAGTVTPEAAQKVVDTLTSVQTKLADLDSDPITPI